jgi:hypothetical protein
MTTKQQAIAISDALGAGWEPVEIAGINGSIIPGALHETADACVHRHPKFSNFSARVLTFHGTGATPQAALAQACQRLTNTVVIKQTVLSALGVIHPAGASPKSQLQQAIKHLQAITDTRRTATQDWEAKTAARAWLASIGIEPT